MSATAVLTVALAVAAADAAPPAPTTAAPASEANGFALIWGGGATRAEGEAAMTSWQAAVAKIPALQFPAGYPRLVESATVPGLKPGFHVVVLGLCPFDDALVPLLLAKHEAPGAYARKTNAAGADSCPTLKSTFKIASRHTVESNGATMRAAIMEDIGTAGGDRTLLIELRDAADTSLDVRIIGNDELDGFSCALDVTTTKEALILKSKCLQPSCTTPAEVDAERHFTIAKKKIQARVASTKTTAGECD